MQDKYIFRTRRRDIPRSGNVMTSLLVLKPIGMKVFSLLRNERSPVLPGLRGWAGLGELETRIDPVNSLLVQKLNR